MSDEIQTASNLGVPYALLAGVKGASGHHARIQPSRAFQSAAEALERLEGQELAGESVLPFWYRGPNPATDAVVVRGKRGEEELLLVRRDDDAPAEAGKWALPGGFLMTGAARGRFGFPGSRLRWRRACGSFARNPGWT